MMCALLIIIATYGLSLAWPSGVDLLGRWRRAGRDEEFDLAADGAAAGFSSEYPSRSPVSSFGAPRTASYMFLGHARVSGSHTSSIQFLN